MKQVLLPFYQCDHCKETSKWEYDIQQHEKTCLDKQKERKQAQENFRLSLAKAETKAIEAARNDKALILLVANGLTKEARQRAIEVFEAEAYFDCYSSSWYEEIYTKMVNAVSV